MTVDELNRELQPWGARRRFADQHNISLVSLWKWSTGRVRLPHWIVKMEVPAKD